MLKRPKNLKEKIKNELKSYSEELSFAIIKNQIIKNIVSSYKFDLPPTLVLREEEIIKKTINPSNQSTEKQEKGIGR